MNPDPSEMVLGRPVGLARLACLAILLGGGLVFLSLAQHIVLPVVVAILLYFLFGPLVRILTRLGIPRLLSAALVLGFFLSGLACAVWWLAGPAGQWLQRLPQSMEVLQSKLSFFRRPVQQVAALAQTVEDATASAVGTVKVTIADGNWTQLLVSHAQIWGSNLLFTVILAFFLLAGGDDLPQRLSRALSSRSSSADPLADELRQKRRAEVLTVLLESESAMSGYLLTVSGINLGLGIAVGMGCWGLGMPNPLLWGFMVFILNYIPYFGAIVGILVLAMAGLLSFDTLAQGLYPAGLYLVLNLLEAELVTPLALKQRFFLDPVITVIWTALWLWLWGVAGGVLAVPILVLLITVARHFPSLHALVIVASPRPRKSPLLPRLPQVDPI